MKCLKKFNNCLSKSKEMDKKSTYSAKLYNAVGLCCNIAAFLAAAITLVVFIFDKDLGTYFWLFAAYFVPVLLLIGLFFSIRERIRGSFLSAKVSIFLGLICLLVLTTLLIYQSVLFEKIYFYPFIKP